MSSARFAFGQSAVVCAAGKEIFAYAPGDEAPLWKKAFALDVAAVAVAGDFVLSIDARGALVQSAADTGDEIARETFVGEPRALEARGRDTYAVALEDAVILASTIDDARTRLAISGARALAFSAKLLAVGTDAGKLIVTSGALTIAEADLGAPIYGIVRHPAGFWLATAGDTVHRVSDAGEVTSFLKSSGRSPVAVACSRDGAMVAVQTAARNVVVVAFPSKDTLLTGTYTDRDAVGVDFAPDGRFVWIGVDEGDANKIDLDEHDVYRTDPHPGRARTTWTLKVQIDKAVRARAKAAAASGAAKALVATVAAPSSTRAPASVIVVAADGPAHVVAYEPEPVGPPEPVMPPSPENEKRIVLGVLAASAILGVLSLFINK